MAIGVYSLDDRDHGSRLAAWAYAADLPVLSVAVADDRRAAVVGPLTIPGVPGCGNCAHHRMLAAAIDREGSWEGDRDADRDAIDLIRGAVSDELAAVNELGPQGSQLVGHVLEVRADMATGVRHRFIPLPHCPICGGAALAIGRPPPGSAGGETEPDPLDGWVDPLTGVIPGLSLDQPACEDSTLPVVVTAAPPHLVDADGSLRRFPIGWGKGLSAADAVRSAVGEAVERYSASLPDPDRLVWARPDELDGDHLDPRDMPLYTDDQYRRKGFPYVPFDPAVAHPWIKGRWFGTDDVWVPAVLVFLSLSIAPENLICQGTSNGLAASTDPDDAALRATLELVERDAFMVAWLTGTPGHPVQIDDTLDAALRAVVDGIEALGGSVELLLLPTSAYGATVACLALGDGDTWPGITIGLAADLDPAEAVRRAVLELGQTGPHLRRLMRSKVLRAPREPVEVRDLLDHAAYYFLPDRASAFDRLRSGGEAVSLASLMEHPAAASLADCEAGLRAARTRVVLVDVTSPDVATGPFRVARALSPDLQPISYGYGLDRAMVPRIRSLGLATPRCPIHPIW